MNFQPAKTPDEFKVPAKTYFHQHNYAKFHFNLGVPGSCKTVEFANYKYITDDRREQEQLFFVADVPGTMIYTIKDSEIAHAIAHEQQQEAHGQIQKAAQAQAAVSGQHFDPSAPITPINNQASAIVGMQNSFSSAQATTQVQVTPLHQSAAPSAVELARAKLMEAAKQA